MTFADRVRDWLGINILIRQQAQMQERSSRGRHSRRSN